ncbi:Phosphoribosylaminoimidazole-succinocarboxamide synthase [Anaplasma phagocytophilum]|uniref:Phosphoribosylaminoimidazole-succinocarboxamide synthase n=1 Tax=Anaplasma phagocytophilum TaxID=948 RepID=A0AA45UT45_ANAPH|nr:phosphoribosylaminoimidazolesuccinocarboxamide synthase [Anaplasma phagocytophilum]SBO14270.1 Phosphoribosylaminoimidazole-succinocarboxamide synthase [Anaplasma phagocytophilum]
MENTREVLYEGKAKIILRHPENERAVIQHFKDTLTAFNAQRKSEIQGKGALTNRISSLLMEHLEASGIRTHFLSFLNEKEQLVSKLNMIPLEVVVRNIAAGSMCKKFGIPKGKVLAEPIVEFYYKNDELSDPMIAEDHAICFGLASKSELAHMREIALQANKILSALFSEVKILLVDFKLEFGKDSHSEQEIVLGDEISPDTCRLWDTSTLTVLDKDLYRFDIGNIEDGYKEVLQRLEQHFKNK